MTNCSSQIIRIVSVPNISIYNPYQKLFYTALEKYGFEVVDDFEFSFKNLWRQRLNVDMIHFHWAHTNDSNFRGWIRVGIFFFRLLFCKFLRIKLVWTAHNLMPHDIKSYAMQFFRRLILVHMVDVIIVHFDGAKKQLRDLFHVSERKMVLMYHGLYDEVYPNVVSSVDARKKLGVPDTATVCLYFGAIRPYKNLEALIEAFNEINASDNIYLVLAGYTRNEEYKLKVQSLGGGNKRIILKIELISDEDIQYYFNASDVVVLPYKNIFTSGTALLALTFHKPLIMKDCAFARDYFIDNNAILVEESTAGELRIALQRFLAQKSKYFVTTEYPKKFYWTEVVKMLGKHRVFSSICRK